MSIRDPYLGLIKAMIKLQDQAYDARSHTRGISEELLAWVCITTKELSIRFNNGLQNSWLYTNNEQARIIRQDIALFKIDLIVQGIKHCK